MLWLLKPTRWLLGEPEFKCKMNQLLINCNDPTTGHKLQGISKDDIIITSWLGGIVFKRLELCCSLKGMNTRCFISVWTDWHGQVFQVFKRIDSIFDTGKTKTDYISETTKLQSLQTSKNIWYVKNWSELWMTSSFCLIFVHAWIFTSLILQTPHNSKKNTCNFSTRWKFTTS